jgi:DNA-binding GntR family transcriptional regulator
MAGYPAEFPRLSAFSHAFVKTFVYAIPMSNSEPARRRNLVDDAYATLRRRIVENHYAGGQSVLEAQLALELGMSRTPIREALARLEAEGWVAILPRRGMRVRPLTARYVREVNEVLASLEAQAAERLASRRPGPAEIAILDSAIAGMDDALAREDMNAWAAADYRFHAAIIDLCGNSILADTARRFLDQAHRFRLLTLAHRGKPVYSNANHAAVVEAIRRGDAETASEIHWSHKRRWGRELDRLIEAARLPLGD